MFNEYKKDIKEIKGWLESKPKDQQALIKIIPLVSIAMIFFILSIFSSWFVFPFAIFMGLFGWITYKEQKRQGEELERQYRIEYEKIDQTLDQARENRRNTETYINKEMKKIDDELTKIRKQIDKNLERIKLPKQNRYKY